MKTETRNLLILKHLPYVQKITKIFCLAYRQEDEGEYQSIAVEKLIISVDSYDNNKGAKLKTWITRNVKIGLSNYFNEQNRKLLDHLGILTNRQYMEGNCLDDYQNALQLSTNGTEQSFTNKDIVEKFLSFLDKPVYHGVGRPQRTDVGEIFQLYFVEGYLMREIAEMKSLSEARISQIISKNKQRIKDRFTNINQGEI